MIKVLKNLLAIDSHQFQKSLIYREQFWITLSALFLWVSIYLVFFEVLFLHVDSVAGWSKGEMLIVLGFYYFGMSIGNTFYRDSFEHFDLNIRQGKLDHVLTKPANPKLLIFFEEMRFDHVIDCFYSLLIFIYAFSITDVNFSVPLLLAGLLAAIVGQMLSFGMLLGLGALVFYVERLDGMGSFIWHLAQISRYPRTSSSTLGKSSFRSWIPLALIGSIPAEIVLGIASLELVLGFTLCLL